MRRGERNDHPVTAAGPQGCRWPPEIAFLAAHGVDPAVLDAAAARAAAHGVSADGILLSEGVVSETRFYASLARTLRLPFSTAMFQTHTGAFTSQALASGMAPLVDGGFVAAPRGRALALLLECGPTGTAPDAHLTITTPSHLAQAIFASRATDVSLQASFALLEKGRHLSAARAGRRSAAGPVHVLAIVVLALSLLNPGLIALSLSIGWSGLFLLSLAMRLGICAASRATSATPRPLPTRRLPDYTVVVPLRREAAVVAKLVKAIDAIEYPAAKLQVLLVVEADDSETIAALGTLALSPVYEILIAPPGLPRTKPRALNVALARARGSLLTVYDAEDVPEARQLQLAAAQFARAPDDLACLQAQLAIFNVGDSWLTRLFAIEYAALFDVMNIGQTACGIPLPLGGTSNHFRVEALRAVGAWDAWNVTEDADLGFRLARFGYRVGSLRSTTYEEAPIRLGAWFAQRRRWCKGWLQTELTLARDPVRLFRDMGAYRSLSTVGVLVALVLSPLAWPLSLVGLCRDAVNIGAPQPVGALEILHATLWTGVIVGGFGLTGWAAWRGMRRRKLQSCWPALALLPVYNVMISAAAWVALYDLAVRPYHWNKTEHGVTSSRAAASGD